jgi:hypothetical protein
MVPPIIAPSIVHPIAMSALLSEKRAMRVRNISGIIKNQTASENPQRNAIVRARVVLTKMVTFWYMLFEKEIHQGEYNNPKETRINPIENSPMTDDVIGGIFDSCATFKVGF